jgi:hypothetical protein
LRSAARSARRAEARAARHPALARMEVRRPVQWDLIPSPGPRPAANPSRIPRFARHHTSARPRASNRRHVPCPSASLCVATAREPERATGPGSTACEQDVGKAETLATVSSEPAGTFGEREGRRRLIEAAAQVENARDRGSGRRAHRALQGTDSLGSAARDRANCELTPRFGRAVGGALRRTI